MNADPYKTPAGLHPTNPAAVDRIDAAVFNGDGFWKPEAIDWLESMMSRWKVQLAVNRVLGSHIDDGAGDENDGMEP